MLRRLILIVAVARPAGRRGWLLAAVGLARAEAGPASGDGRGRLDARVRRAPARRAGRHSRALPRPIGPWPSCSARPIRSRPANSRFRPGTSGAEVLDILQHGRPVVRLVTIPEGMPSILVQEKLAAIPELTGPAPLPAEGSVLPNSYDWQRGESRAAVLKRMTDAMAKELDALWAKRKWNCPVNSQGGSDHPRLDRREGNRQAVGAADGRGRLLQPAADRHEARCRPDRHLPDHQGQAARPADQAVGAQCHHRLQHLSRAGPARRGRSPIRAATASPRCSIRRRPRRSISSPTAPAAMCSPTRWPSIMPMSRKWYAIRRARGEM